MPAPRIVSRLADVADAYDAILCDVWGVLHDGRAAFPDASAALAPFRAGGGAVVALTNAPRPNPPIAAQMLSLGVARDAFDAVVTSGDTTLAMIAAHGAAPLHHIGHARDLSLFEEAEARLGRPIPRVGPQDAVYVVCTGLEDDRVETPADYADRLAALAARGLAFVCANPDIVIHRGADLVYCAGALAREYRALGGEVLYAGKPHAPIYDLGLATLARVLGREPQRVLAIGDGFATDMNGARARGLDTLFVAGGIHRADALADGRIDPDRLAALFAAEGYAPTATIKTLR